MTLVAISDRLIFLILNMVVCIVVLHSQTLHGTNRVDAWKVMMMMSSVVSGIGNDGICLLEIERQLHQLNG